MTRLVLILSVLFSAGNVIPMGQASLEQLQSRDSILVADQLEYSFTLDSITPGTGISLPDYEKIFNDTLVLVRNWKVDTLRMPKNGRQLAREGIRIKGSLILAPFEEGVFTLPPILVVRSDGSSSDTLVFSPPQLQVTTIPVDTATFEMHDLKAQIRYPLTFTELLPYTGIAVVLAALALLVVHLIRRRRSSLDSAAHKDPPHIVALRSLDRYRGDRFWAPDKQKLMYSGITDALRTYIEARFGVNAEEMTTAEIFDALKRCPDITPDLYSDTKALFELSDFVKFAKHTASDEDNAAAIPTAVRFVTATYQVELEEESNGTVPGGEEAASR